MALYQKSIKEAKPAGDKKYEAHFNLATEASKVAGCSKIAPKEQTHSKSLNIKEKMPSTDNILIDFESGDMFGDLE